MRDPGSADWSLATARARWRSPIDSTPIPTDPLGTTRCDSGAVGGDPTWARAGKEACGLRERQKREGRGRASESAPDADQTDPGGADAEVPTHPDHAASTQDAGAEAGKPPPLLHPAYKQPAGIEASRSLDPNSPTERFSQHYCARCQYPRIREMAEV